MCTWREGRSFRTYSESNGRRSGDRHSGQFLCDYRVSVQRFQLASSLRDCTMGSTRNSNYVFRRACIAHRQPGDMCAKLYSFDYFSYTNKGRRDIMT